MASVYFDPAVGGNGTTVTDDSNPTTGLANGGHRARFVPALAQTVAVAANTVNMAQQAAAHSFTAETAAASAIASRNEASNYATVAGDYANQAKVTSLSVETLLPKFRPTLMLDFANSRQLDSRITFTRASIATYFDAKGVLQTAASGVARFDHNPTTFESLGLLIEEQRANLCLQSENFATTWTTAQASITTNTAIAPDGTLTGDKLVEDTANNSHAVQQVRSFTTGTTYSFSVYVKAAERTRINMQAATTATFGISANFDLSNGTIISTTFGSASIQNVGNGWYRCTAIGASTQTASTNIRINLISSGTATNYAGNGFSGLFLWGAQLEAGAFPTSYIPTVASQVTRAADAASMTGANFSSWYNQGEGTLYQEYSAIGVSELDRVSVRISDGGAAFTNDISFRNYNGSGTAYQVFVAGVGQLFGMNFIPVLTAGSPNFMAAVYKFNDFAGAKNGGAVQTDTSGILPVVNQLSFPSSGCNTIKKFAYYPLRVTNAQLQGLTS